MKMAPLALRPTAVPEWDAEDEVASVLAYSALAKASDAESKEMLDALRLEFPNVENIESVKLRQYARQRQTPLELNLPPDDEHYDFYLIELPLNILAPKQRLTRLRVRLDLGADGQKSGKVAAYDLFPHDQTDLKTIATGEVSLDISNALKFIPAVGTVLTEVFGFKLSMPIKWTSTSITMHTSDRMSNPVEWYIIDNSIQNGFTGYLIIRAPKNSKVNIVAGLTCEVRKPGPFGKFLKAQYVTDSRTYVVS
jgi:hypothetical protein